MDYLTSEWPGTPNFKVDANFDVFPPNYEYVRYLLNCPNAGLLHYFLERALKMGKKGYFRISAN